jgi:hypothetical protein
MKTLIIIFILILISFIIFQAYVARSTARTEEQKYKVLEKDGDFEIRYYPKVVMATVSMPSNSYNKMSSSGFRRLAGYIFGGNEQKESIAMTAPVHMQVKEDSASMSFVMPSSYSMNTLPVPKDSGVKIHMSEEEYVASVTYSGFSSDEDIRVQTARLKEFLDKKGIVYSGDFRYLGYNPPYQLKGRRNEVIVHIEYNEKSK